MPSLRGRGELRLLRSDIRNLSRYLAELEELIEGYRTFAANATLATQADRVVRRKLLLKTQKVIGPPPDERSGPPSQDCQVTEKITPG